MARSKTRSRGGVGTFFLGSFIGFLLCLLVLGGSVCLIYFKVTPEWINNTFNTNLDLGSPAANKKSLSDLVGGAVQLAQNIDNYKLKNLKSDFGIELSDELFGIDISDLKDVKISDLGEAIEKKFSNISADELKNIAGMGLADDMGHILNEENTYYVNSTEEKKGLYKDESHNTPVTFDYKLVWSSETVTHVTTKGNTEAVMDGKVSIPLWYLPLTDALGDFTKNMGSNITLAELETSYGVDLPSFLDNDRIDKSTTPINGLENAIKNLLVADFLGYTIDSSDPDNIIVKDSQGNTITGILKTIAQFTVDGLKTGIDGLTLKEIFDEDELQTGALSLIPSTTKFTDIASVLNAKMQTITLGEVIDKKIITLDEESQQAYDSKKNQYVSGTTTLLKDLPLKELMEMSIGSIPTQSA